MKRLAMIMGALALSSALSFGEEITHPVNFRDEVNFDKPCVWNIQKTKVTPSAAELNIMDGCTATTAELNLSGAGYVAATNGQANANIALTNWTSRMGTTETVATNGQANANIALTNWSARVGATEIVATNAQTKAVVALTNWNSRVGTTETVATNAQSNANIGLTNWTSRMGTLETTIVASTIAGTITNNVAGGNVTIATTKALVMAPVAISVTNGQAITVAAPCYIIKGIDGVTDTTNSVTLAAPDVAGRVVVFLGDVTATNFIRFPYNGATRVPAALDTGYLGGDDTVTFISLDTSTWLCTGFVTNK